jgi:hypothetical protein
VIGRNGTVVRMRAYTQLYSLKWGRVNSIEELVVLRFTGVHRPLGVRGIPIIMQSRLCEAHEFNSLIHPPLII